MWLFRRPKPRQRCRTVWMRKSATGYHPWICQGYEGDGHHCVLWVEGKVTDRAGGGP